MTVSIHNAIYALVQHEFPDDYNETQVLRRMFSNLISSGPGYKGLHLSQHGYRVLRKHLECYEYKLPHLEAISIRKKQALSKAMQYPYFFRKNQLVFFGGTDAAMFVLLEHNLDALIDALGTTPKKHLT